MRDINPKWITIVAAAAVILGLAGYWAMGPERGTQETEPEPTLTTVVDRGLGEEQEALLRQRIADFEARVAENEATGARDISVILELGNLYYHVGELETAAGWYRDILRTHPEDAPALENLAQVLLEMGDWDGAETTLRAAVNVSAYEPTYLKLVDLIEEHFPEKSSEIKEILETAIANLGQTPGLLARLGRWYEQNGMLDEAISHYQVAHQIDPEDQAVKSELDRLRAERSAAAEKGERSIER